MAAETGAMRQSRRSLGLGRGSSEQVLDGDRTVVMKTTGKIAARPKRGSGMGRRAAMALPTPSGGLAPVRSRGRVSVPKNTGTSA